MAIDQVKEGIGGDRSRGSTSCTGRDRHNCSVFRGTLLFRVPVPRNRDGTEQNFESSAERGTGTEQNFGISAERGTGTEQNFGIYAERGTGMEQLFK